jgi:hypothetical protein
VHLHLQGVGSGRGRLLAPQRVEQRVAGDDLVRLHEQQREEAHLAAGAERHRFVAVDDLERSE